MSQAASEADPLLTLIGLGQQARQAQSLDELLFLLVNGGKAVMPYRQAWCWRASQGISHVSGVLMPERHSPFMQWAVELSEHLASQPELAGRTLDRADVPPPLQEGWDRWMPAQAWWLPLSWGAGPAGLLLAEDHLDPQRLPLWLEWLDIWVLAAERKTLQQGVSLSGFLRNWVAQPRRAGKRWLRSGWLWLALVLAGLAYVPVPLTVVGQGELVPRQPVVVRAPLDGVINEFHVSPNQLVKAGQPLFSYDNDVVRSRLQVAQQNLATAQAEYRQAAQSALSDARAKFQIAALVGKIQEKQAELKFLSTQVGRTTVSAPQAGMVLFDDVSEWIGKPVQTGERVVRMADPSDVELEVWVNLADAVPMQPGDEVKLFMSANPLHALQAKVRWVGHEAQPRPDGSYAYRVRAELTARSAFSVGAKGTARLSAGTVSLAYWLFRKPLSVLRGYLLV